MSSTRIKCIVPQLLGICDNVSTSSGGGGISSYLSAYSTVDVVVPVSGMLPPLGTPVAFDITETAVGGFVAPTVGSTVFTIPNTGTYLISTAVAVNITSVISGIAHQAVLIRPSPSGDMRGNGTLFASVPPVAAGTAFNWAIEGTVQMNFTTGDTFTVNLVTFGITLDPPNNPFIIRGYVNPAPIIRGTQISIVQIA